MKLLAETLKQIEPQDSSSRAAAHARLEQLAILYWGLAMHLVLAAVRVLTEVASFEEAAVSKAN
jgi:hypothetical protein